MELINDADTTVSVRDWAADQLHNPTYYVWGGGTYGHDEDEPAVGGDTVTMGYNSMAGVDHYRIVDEATHVEVPFTVWSDYSGGVVERSNARALRDAYPDTFVTVTGGYGTEFLVLPLDAEIPEALADEISGLFEYCVYDECDMSALEHDIETEDWDSFGRDELRDYVRALMGEHFDADIPDDLLDDAWQHVRSEGVGWEWEAETAVSGYFQKTALEDAARWAAAQIRKLEGAGQ